MNNPKIAQISRLILQNKQSMIKEQDIQNFFSTSQEYQETLVLVVQKFREIGLSLVRTTFNHEKYFVLTSAGKDEKISPLMYGILGIIIALQNDFGKPVSKKDAQQIFKDVWDDLLLLAELKYIVFQDKDESTNIILTPIGKAATQKIAKDLNIRSFIDIEE